jgi:hypothetical protein
MGKLPLLEGADPVEMLAQEKEAVEAAVARNAKLHQSVR